MPDTGRRIQAVFPLGAKRDKGFQIEGSVAETYAKLFTSNWLKSAMNVLFRGALVTIFVLASRDLRV